MPRLPPVLRYFWSTSRGPLVAKKLDPGSPRLASPITIYALIPSLIVSLHVPLSFSRRARVRVCEYYVDGTRHL